MGNICYERNELHFHSHVDLSFLAARYLCRALRHRLTGNDLYIMAQLWHEYLGVAIRKPEYIEWSNFDDCVGTLCLSGKPIASFETPTLLEKLFGSLLRGALFDSYHHHLQFSHASCPLSWLECHQLAMYSTLFNVCILSYSNKRSQAQSLPQRISRSRSQFGTSFESLLLQLSHRTTRRQPHVLTSLTT